jgi:hypothetical protein
VRVARSRWRRLPQSRSHLGAGIRSPSLSSSSSSSGCLVVSSSGSLVVSVSQYDTQSDHLDRTLLERGHANARTACSLTRMWEATIVPSVDTGGAVDVVLQVFELARDLCCCVLLPGLRWISSPHQQTWSTSWYMCCTLYRYGKLRKISRNYN